MSRERVRGAAPYSRKRRRDNRSHAAEPARVEERPAAPRGPASQPGAPEGPEPKDLPPRR